MGQTHGAAWVMLHCSITASLPQNAAVSTGFFA